MPWIPIEERKQLLGPTGHPCPKCHAPQIRHYCRSCDEFFLICLCTALELEALMAASEPWQHAGHRIYAWTHNEGIIAVPNFDDL